MATYTQTNLPVDFEAASGCEEAKRWRAERVGGREHDATVVDAVLVGRGGRAADGEVPGEEVFFGWGGMKVGGGLGGEFLSFTYWIES